jgi:cell division protein FtsN
MARRGEGNYQFSLIELSVLAVGVLATVSAVFLMGFYVGRESAGEHAPLDERVARIPISENAGVAKKPAAARPPPPPAAPPPAAPPPAPPAVATAPQAPSTTPQSGVPYTVQVLATRNKAEAEDLRAQLVRRSIGAFISAVEEAGTRWYRVRIGRYDDIAAARGMESRVRREMGLTQASIVPAATESR